MEILGPATARYDTAAVPLSPQRARVLELLQRSASSVTVESLAKRSGLHPNTARKHLEGLVARGLATRSPAPIVGRGRPGWEYTAALGQAEPDHRVRDYAGLAGALAAHISRTSSDPEADALDAGDTWGRSLVTDLSAGSPAHARRQVVGLLARLGFDPSGDARGTRVRLRRCPLLDVARAQPDIVCPLHLGLVRGALAELGGDPQRAHLRPFAEPGACLLHLNDPIAGAPPRHA